MKRDFGAFDYFCEIDSVNSVTSSVQRRVRDFVLTFFSGIELFGA